MVIVLSAKVSVLGKAARKAVLSRALYQVVATHLCVVMGRRGSRCCAVGAGSMGGAVVVVRAVGHACGGAGRGACGGTVARHRAHAQWPKAKWCSCTAGWYTHSDACTAAIHGRQSGARAARVLAQTSTTIGEPDLDARLSQAGGLSELLSGIDIRVLGAWEGALESLQLLGGECGAGASLFAFERNTRLRFGVTDVRVPACAKRDESLLKATKNYKRLVRSHKILYAQRCWMGYWEGKLLNHIRWGHRRGGGSIVGLCEIPSAWEWESEWKMGMGMWIWMGEGKGQMSGTGSGSGSVDVHCAPLHINWNVRERNKSVKSGRRRSQHSSRSDDESTKQFAEAGEEGALPQAARKSHHSWQVTQYIKLHKRMTIGKLSTGKGEPLSRHGGVRQLTSASVYESKCRLALKSGMKRGVWQRSQRSVVGSRLQLEGMPNYLESSLHNKLTLGLARVHFKEVRNYSTRSQDHFS